MVRKYFLVRKSTSTTPAGKQVPPPKQTTGDAAVFETQADADAKLTGAVKGNKERKKKEEKSREQVETPIKRFTRSKNKVPHGVDIDDEEDKYDDRGGRKPNRSYTKPKAPPKQQAAKKGKTATAPKVATTTATPFTAGRAGGGCSGGDATAVMLGMVLSKLDSVIENKKKHGDADEEDEDDSRSKSRHRKPASLAPAALPIAVVDKAAIFKKQMDDYVWKQSILKSVQ